MDYLSMRKVSGHLIRLRLEFVNNGSTERPSICGGASTPAMSRKVGAKSILSTISSTTDPGSTPGPRTKNGTLTSNSNGKLFPYKIKLAIKTTSHKIYHQYFDEAELSKMVTVIRCVNNVGVFEFTKSLEFLDDSLDGGIDGL